MRNGRLGYAVHFQVPDHEHDGIFPSLADTMRFAASYIVDHELRASDILISDPFANWRGWRSISRTPVELKEPWLAVSEMAVKALSAHLKALHATDSWRVTIAPTGRCTSGNRCRRCLTAAACSVQWTTCSKNLSTARTTSVRDATAYLRTCR